jgi:hypothetical protein
LDKGCCTVRQVTTYPPIMAGHLVTIGNTNLTLSPQASRDIDTPNLGYHYSVLDYTFGGVFVTNSTITLQTGTAIGLYSPTNGGSSYYGITLADASKFFSDGSATNLNRIIRYNMVQEQSTSTWNTAPNDHILTPFSGTGAVTGPEVRFTLPSGRFQPRMRTIFTATTKQMRWHRSAIASSSAASSGPNARN